MKEKNSIGIRLMPGFFLALVKEIKQLTIIPLK
jgi:hypothetical protein